MNKNLIVIAKKENSNRLKLALLNEGVNVTAAVADIAATLPLGSLIKSLDEARSSFRTFQFFKKLSAFIEPSMRDDISDENRQEFVKSLENKAEDVEQYLFFLIENAESEKKAQAMGIVYRAAVLGKIDCDMMLRLASIINRGFMPDFKHLPEYVEKNSEDSIVANEFVNLGLIDNYPGGTWMNEPSWELNEIGLKLYDILQDSNWFDGRQ